MTERVMAQTAAPPCGLEPHSSPRRQWDGRRAGGAPVHNFGDLAVCRPAPTLSVSAPVIQRAADDSNGDGGEPPAPVPETPQQPADNGQNGTGAGAGGLIVEDSVTDPAPDQMRKSDFLTQLRPAVVSAATDGSDDPAGANAQIEDRLNYYSDQDATALESDIRQYAQEAANAGTAMDYIPVVAEAVRDAISSGNTPSPPADAAGPRLSGSDFGLVGFKRNEPGPAPGSPRAIQRRLGRGAPLEGGLRTRMESAFGYDFSRVRVHNDHGAAKVSSSLKARAFTVGEHVAFGSNEYRPGTLTGDALIAHELAHVVQQDGGAPAAQTQSMNAGQDALEEEADMSAIRAIASMWGSAKALLGNLAQNATPALKSGLGLSRCCPESTCNKKKIISIDVDIFEFPGRTLDPDKEVAGASRIWRAGAGIQFNAIKHVVSEPDAQRLIGLEPSEKGMAAKDLSLQYALFPYTSAEADEILALHNESAKAKGFLTAFFVPDLHGLGASHSGVDSEPGVKIAYIGKGPSAACPDGFTLAHELGHLLIDPNRSVKSHNFASGLMNSPSSRCSENIDCDECGIAR
jgi:hypothetical protein